MAEFKNRLKALWQTIVHLILNQRLDRPPKNTGVLVSDRHPPSTEQIPPIDLSSLPPSSVELPAAPARGLRVEANEMPPAVAVTIEQQAENRAPSLIVYGLGHFRVFCDDQPINKWASKKGKAIFKYIVAHRDRPIAKDVLMDVFWPNGNPEAARNNLNVAIHGLRQAFRAVQPDCAYVLYEDNHYFINLSIAMWIDFEEFIKHYETAQSLERKHKTEEALNEYETAECLYQGDFLEEDLYEDWVIPKREALKDTYLIILDHLSGHYLKEKKYAASIHFCQKILAKDDCREDAHRRLMVSYTLQGERNLALRQYEQCVDNLKRVLDMPPMEETAELYHRIRNGSAP